jgi:hypothetical protein
LDRKEFDNLDKKLERIEKNIDHYIELFEKTTDPKEKNSIDEILSGQYEIEAELNAELQKRKYKAFTRKQSNENARKELKKKGEEKLKNNAANKIQRVLKNKTNKSRELRGMAEEEALTRGNMKVEKEAANTIKRMFKSRKGKSRNDNNDMNSPGDVEPTSNRKSNTSDRSGLNGRRVSFSRPGTTPGTTPKQKTPFMQLLSDAKTAASETTPMATMSREEIRQQVQERAEEIKAKKAENPAHYPPTPKRSPSKNKSAEAVEAAKGGISNTPGPTPTTPIGPLSAYLKSKGHHSPTQSSFNSSGPHTVRLRPPKQPPSPSEENVSTEPGITQEDKQEVEQINDEYQKKYKEMIEERLKKHVPIQDQIKEDREIVEKYKEVKNELEDYKDRRFKVNKTTKAKVNALLKKITKGAVNIGASVYSNSLYKLLERVSQPVEANIAKLEAQTKAAEIEKSQRNQAGGGGVRYPPQGKAKVNTVEGLKQGYGFDTTRSTRSTKTNDNDPLYTEVVRQGEPVVKKTGGGKKK